MATGTEAEGRLPGQGQAAEIADAGALERALADAHRTPEQVEQFGVESVPSERKTTGFFDLFSIELAFQINNLTIITPALAVLAGLNIWAALLSQIVGVGLVFVGYCAIATYGARYGIPGQVGTRFAFGMNGARLLPGVMRSIASAFWFAWQTLAAALGLQVVIAAWTGHKVSLVAISVIFAVFQTLIALLGWESLKIVTRVVLPIKVVGLLLVILFFMTSTRPEFAWHSVSSGGSWSWPLIAFWAATIVGGQLSMYTDSADLARYARSWKQMIPAFYLSTMLSVVLCGFIGVVAAKAVHDFNWFLAAVKVQPYAWMYLLLVVVIVADNWFINIMNLYTGGFAIVNIIPRIGRFWATCLCAAAGILLASVTGILDNTPTIVNEIGFAFSPVGGIIIAHYLVLSRSKIDVPALHSWRSGRYRYFLGFNPVALGCFVPGYLLARSTLLPSWCIPNLTALVLTGLLYVVVMYLVARFWEPVRSSFSHREMTGTYSALELDKELLGNRDL